MVGISDWVYYNRDNSAHLSAPIGQYIRRKSDGPPGIEGRRGVKEPVRTAKQRRFPRSNAFTFLSLLRERVPMSPKHNVCVVSKDNSLSNSLKGPCKSAGLSMTVYGSAGDFVDALDPDKPVG